jgi:uncharacterized protein YndB with AHSA1/START domain
VIQAIESVRREIVVPVPAERAFAVFTDGMTSWWPAEHHIGTAPIEEIVIEPREGGRWFTRHTDGSETSTGHVIAWEPGERLVVTWQIGADWKYHVDLVTTIEVRFVAEAPDRTRVLLEHRDLEAFGADAERMRATFEEPGAWQATLTAYAAGLGRG